MKINYDGLYKTVSSRIPNESDQLCMIPSPEIFDLGNQWLSNLTHTCFDETYALSQTSQDSTRLEDFSGLNTDFPTNFPLNNFNDTWDREEKMKYHSPLSDSHSSYLRSPHETTHVGVIQKKSINNINGSQYGSKSFEQTSYRNYGPSNNTASIHQPTKTKNKNEWNYYINQAAAVGRNKPATIPTTIGAVPDHDNHNWKNQNRRRSNGIEFNGLVHTKFHSNQSMRS